MRGEGVGIVQRIQPHTWYCMGMLWLKGGRLISVKLHAEIAKWSYVQLEFAPPSRPPRFRKGVNSCFKQNGSLSRLHGKKSYKE